MALAPGTRIGPYEVVALLGAGGMGEVYRATDPRLGRDVAVKVLLEATHAGPDRVARFDREARLLASINHPNIATIYGVEDRGGSSAIVMELVEGPSLADLIARGPLDLATSARIASQIADGLSSAHARGIVHRDLKPENVRIALDGRVKILDLGLAKMLAPDADGVAGRVEPDAAETAVGGTRVGTILGTAAYMSPEQAAGSPVRSIVDALEIRLTPREAEQIAERPIADVRAQECYLRARSEIWSFLPGSLDRATSHLETALRLVGDNALVYQGLGEAYNQRVNIGVAVGREEEYLRKAEWCADRIFTLEPDSPRGHLVRANVHLARGDVHACARSLRRVLGVYPNEVSALFLYVHLLGWLVGKPEAAAAPAARLESIDPLSAPALLVCAMVRLFAGRFEEAVEASRRMFALDPVTPVWRANFVMALAYNRQLDEAEALTDGVVAEPDSDVGTWQMGLLRAAWRRDRPEVLRLAEGPYRQVARWDAEIPWLLASTHAAVGLADEALHWLERAIDGGMINYPFLSEHDRLLDGLRDDPRFAGVLARARREWERFEV